MWSSCLLMPLLSMTVSQNLLAFDDLDSFDAHWLDIFWNASIGTYLFFSWLDEGSGFWAGGSHCIISRVHAIVENPFFLPFPAFIG